MFHRSLSKNNLRSQFCELSINLVNGNPNFIQQPEKFTQPVKLFTKLARIKQFYSLIILELACYTVTNILIL